MDAELYGNLIYNVGFESDNGGHGHSIYVQNTSGTKRIVDNILFNGFSFGIHAYTEGGRIDYVHMKGNTIFNHGVLSAASGAKANLYMGGGDDADFPVIQNNYLYYSPFESEGRNIDLRPSCNSGTVTGNYAAGGTAVSLSCVGTTVTGNFFAGEAFLDSAYPSNTYTATSPPRRRCSCVPTPTSLAREPTSQSSIGTASRMCSSISRPPGCRSARSLKSAMRKTTSATQWSRACIRARRS